MFVSDWMLQGHNLLGFIFVILSVIFMFMAFAAFRHSKTLVLCLGFVFLCSGLAGYFLSSFSTRRQVPK